MIDTTKKMIFDVVFSEITPDSHHRVVRIVPKTDIIDAVIVTAANIKDNTVGVSIGDDVISLYVIHSDVLNDKEKIRAAAVILAYHLCKYSDKSVEKIASEIYGSYTFKFGRMKKSSTSKYELCMTISGADIGEELSTRTDIYMRDGDELYSVNVIYCNNGYYVTYERR